MYCYLKQNTIARRSTVVDKFFSSDNIQAYIAATSHQTMSRLVLHLPQFEFTVKFHNSY